MSQVILVARQLFLNINGNSSDSLLLYQMDAFTTIGLINSVLVPRINHIMTKCLFLIPQVNVGRVVQMLTGHNFFNYHENLICPLQCLVLFLLVFTGNHLLCECVVFPRWCLAINLCILKAILLNVTLFLFRLLYPCCLPHFSGLQLNTI
jgi:hypothetical protein